jgi:hypothetical protein
MSLIPIQARTPAAKRALQRGRCMTRLATLTRGVVIAVAGLIDGTAHAAVCEALTFECLHPQLLKTEPASAYSRHESAVSPALYDPDHGDYLAEFSSPSGKHVRIIVKAPITHDTYDVPPIGDHETVDAYLNDALYLAPNTPRQGTLINLPKDTYNFDFPLFSNCASTATHTPQYVHWQVANASDLVIDGHGSTVNFSDFCLGLNLANVNRVTLKNFVFSWPNIQIASVATVVAVGGNGTTGYTYDVKIDIRAGARTPKMIAAATAWNKGADHWDLINPNDDVSYGDGIDSGTPLRCTTKTAGVCLVKNIPSYGVQFKVGESLLLRYYSFATAISLSGNDITLDHITFKNLIGSDFSYNQGRGLHVTHALLTRMSGQPVSAGGGGSLITNVGGDVVIDNSWFGYQSDDAFDMNTTIVRFTPTPVSNSTPMNTLTFDASAPTQLPWPAANIAQTGDVIGLFDNALAFKGIAIVTSVSIPTSGANPVLTLDRAVNATLGASGFIAGDLTSSSGARYLIDGNVFAYNRARALLLQTPYGWINDNTFVGQTLKQVYVLASQYWGEGAGAQELLLTGNHFDAAHRNYLSGFFALDILAEAADFPNVQDEVAGTTHAAPPINQNIISANNVFETSTAQALINVSSANNVLFFKDSIDLVDEDAPEGPNEFPIAVHDASNVFFDEIAAYSASLPGVSCAGSIMLELSSPPPLVSAFEPIACQVEATTSGLDYLRP